MNLLLTAASVLLTVLAYPPFGIWPAGLVMLAPLVIAIERSSPRRACLLTYAYYAGMGLGIVRWLVHAMAVEYGTRRSLGPGASRCCWWPRTPWCRPSRASATAGCGWAFRRRGRRCSSRPAGPSPSGFAGARADCPGCWWVTRSHRSRWRCRPLTSAGSTPWASS